MAQAEKVTVITSTHDRLKSLKEAVASVLSQSYRNWEHFIVSDGYDPRVKEYVRSLKDPRIKYLFTLRTKYPGNLQRNLALKFASGEYVFCLDDDNLIERQFMEKMTACFSDDKIGYTVCHILYDGDGILAPQFPLKLGGVDMLNYMVRTSLARRFGGWVPVNDYCADFYLIKKISRVSQGGFVPEILGWHRTLKAEDGPKNKKNRLSSTAIKINRFCYKVLCKIWLKF
ncbi:MAG: glycosyltransferase family 2 protein [Candidatus Omnitrophica bacterium]|nr:glycosyltransferase family 2 protein [Candidatus Omnitrophota bacterium]